MRIDTDSDDKHTVRGFRWDWPDGGPWRLIFRQSLKHPGRAFYEVWDRRGGRVSNDWLPAPPWVHAALGASDDPTGLLDWLLEAVPDDDHLAAAVRAIVAAGDVVLT